MRAPDSPQIPVPVAREWVALALAGVILASLTFAFLFGSGGGDREQQPPAVVLQRTPVPQLDRDLLATVRDSTRNERIPVEREPLAHLLQKSLRVVPAMAEELQLPEIPVPFDQLRADPEGWRGRYLWYKGQLESLSEGRPGHPVKGYEIYEARIRTPEGEPVVFTFSVPPPPELDVGDWVRVEGFLLKLRDAHFPAPLTQAPHLVGPELLEAQPDWKAVEHMERAVLARVRDGVRHEGVDIDLQDAPLTLVESQDTPLWHVASHAMWQAEHMTAEQRQALPFFEQKDQWNALLDCRGERGSAWRLGGEFRQARVYEARANPLGIEYWSEVWLHNVHFAPRSFPIWIPGNIGDWEANVPVRATGLFFKRYAYLGGDDRMHLAPVFVAAGLTRLDLSPHPSHRTAGYLLIGGFAIIALAFVYMVRRDRKDSREHAERMTRRRRRQPQVQLEHSTS